MSQTYPPHTDPELARKYEGAVATLNRERRSSLTGKARIRAIDRAERNVERLHAEIIHAATQPYLAEHPRPLIVRTPHTCLGAP